MFTDEELNTIRWIMERSLDDGKLSKTMRQRAYNIVGKVDVYFDEKIGETHDRQS